MVFSFLTNTLLVSILMQELTYMIMVLVNLFLLIISSLSQLTMEKLKYFLSTTNEKLSNKTL